ncbi:MAG: hypothetical protein V5A37_02250, partial [Halobacteriales archaeon]
MNRRRLLAAAASVAGLAGCLDRSKRGAGGATGSEAPDGSPGDESPDGSPANESPTVVDATPCPERPASWSPETVEPFLLAFERAYLERSIRRLNSDVVDVSHDFGLRVDSVSEADGDFLATLTGGYA